jgi:hypothetical protein
MVEKSLGRIGSFGLALARKRGEARGERGERASARWGPMDRPMGNPDDRLLGPEATARIGSVDDGSSRPETEREQWECCRRRI